MEARHRCVRATWGGLWVHTARVAACAALVACADDDPAPPTGEGGGGAGASTTASTTSTTDTGTGGGSSGGGGSGGGGGAPTATCASGGAGPAEWSCVYGTAGEENIMGAEADAAGNFVVTGWGTLFDGLPTPPAGGSAIPLAKYAPSGTSLWKKQFICTDGFPDDSNALAVDGTDIVVAGSCVGTVDFGAGDPPGEGNTFVTKLDESGDPVWSVRIGGSQGVSVVDEGGGVTDAAIDDSGRVVLAISTFGAMDFGAGPIAGGGGVDAYVVVLDANGAPLWAHGVLAAGNQYAWSVATTPDQGVIFAGSFEGTIDLGGGPLTSAGQHDYFVAKLDAAGNHVWSKRFGDAAQQIVSRVAVDASGDLRLSGMFEGTIDLGGGPLTAAGADVFAARLDPDGNHVWSKSVGSDDAWTGGIAIDADGTLVLGGTFATTIDFGGGALPASQEPAAFVAKLDANGNHVDSHAFGSTEYPGAAVTAVAVGPSGATLLGGWTSSAIDFGNGPLAWAGYYDGFVAMLPP